MPFKFRFFCKRRVVTSSQMHSRIEVYPPPLWKMSNSPLSRFMRAVRRILDQIIGRWLPVPRKTVTPLVEIKEVFVASLDGVGWTGDLPDQIDQARSLRELWYIRAAVYDSVAIAISEAEAEKRLARLNRYFPTRVPQSGSVERKL